MKTNWNGDTAMTFDKIRTRFAPSPTGYMPVSYTHLPVAVKNEYVRPKHIHSLKVMLVPLQRIRKAPLITGKKHEGIKRTGKRVHRYDPHPASVRNTAEFPDIGRRNFTEGIKKDFRTGNSPPSKLFQRNFGQPGIKARGGNTKFHNSSPYFYSIIILSLMP